MVNESKKQKEEDKRRRKREEEELLRQRYLEKSPLQTRFQAFKSKEYKQQIVLQPQQYKDNKQSFEKNRRRLRKFFKREMKRKI